MPWTIAWLLPLCGLVGGCRPSRPPHRCLPSGNTRSAPWRKHVRPSVHAWAPAAERLWSASVNDLDPGCRLTCPQITCYRILCGCGHPLQHCGRLPRQISSWCQDVCCSCSKAMSGWRSQCRWRARPGSCRQTSEQPSAIVCSNRQSERAPLQGEGCRTTGPRLRRPTSGPIPVVSLRVCRSNRLPMQRMWRSA